MFPPTRPRAIAALAAAFLTAVSIPCSGADEHYLTVVARTAIAGEYDQVSSTEEDANLWEAVSHGTQQNSASARAWRDGLFLGDSWLFGAGAQLRADSGPQFSKKTFSGISQTITQALVSTRRVETFEPWHTPQFRLTYVVIDPQRLIQREGKAGGFDISLREFSSFKPLYEVHATRSGARSLTGTIGEGYKTLTTELFAGTGELKPSYRFGGEKAVTGEINVMAIIDFLGWSGDSAELHDNAVSFVDTAIDLRIRADALAATARAAENALLAMSNAFPDDFAKEFRVVPVSGKTDRYTIAHRAGNDMAGFAAALEASIAHQKLLRRQHDDLILRIKEAVDDGQYPPTALLQLNSKYPEPSAATAKKFKQLTFFLKNKPRTKKEVEAVKKDFDAARKWQKKETATLKKRVKRLDNHTPSIVRTLQDVYQDHSNAIDESSLSSRGQAVLRTTLGMAKWAWREE